MKFGVISFPGSCDDVDALMACERVGEAVSLWHADHNLAGVSKGGKTRERGEKRRRNRQQRFAHFHSDFSTEHGYRHKLAGTNRPLSKMPRR